MLNEFRSMTFRFLIFYDINLNRVFQRVAEVKEMANGSNQAKEVSKKWE
jgi:hypothetical protein